MFRRDSAGCRAWRAVLSVGRSAALYRDPLGLAYVREVGEGTTVTGCAWADSKRIATSRYLRRDTLVGGEADLTASLSQWVVYRAIAR